MRRATAHANPSKVSLILIHFANRSTVSSLCDNKVFRRWLSGSAQNAGPSTVSQGPLESMRTCVSRVAQIMISFWEQSQLRQRKTARYRPNLKLRQRRWRRGRVHQPVALF